jgi:hypothetical protein
MLACHRNQTHPTFPILWLPAKLVDLCGLRSCGHPFGWSDWVRQITKLGRMAQPAMFAYADEKVFNEEPRTAGRRRPIRRPARSPSPTGWFMYLLDIFVVELDSATCDQSKAQAVNPTIADGNSMPDGTG